MTAPQHVGILLDTADYLGAGPSGFTLRRGCRCHSLLSRPDPGLGLGRPTFANKEFNATATRVRLVGLAAGLSVEDVRAMGMRDYVRLNGLLLDFG